MALLLRTCYRWLDNGHGDHAGHDDRAARNDHAGQDNRGDQDDKSDSDDYVDHYAEADQDKHFHICLRSA